jgi:hypothetical protein
MLELANVDVPTMRKWKADAKDWSTKLKAFPKSITSVFGNSMLKKKRIQFHQVDLEKIIRSDSNIFPIEKQKYTDLLMYKDNQPFSNRRELLQIALRRFSKGEVLFSKSKNGQLEWFCWMKEVKGEIEIEGSTETILMNDGDTAKVLYDFYTSSNLENAGFEESVLDVIPQIDLNENEKIWLATDREKGFSFS